MGTACDRRTVVGSSWCTDLGGGVEIMSVISRTLLLAEFFLGKLRGKGKSNDISNVVETYICQDEK